MTIDQTAVLDASGATGGTVFIDSPNGQSTVRGVVSAVGRDGAGGNIRVTGQTVGIDSTANIDASGLNGGGEVLVGGGLRGADASVRNAERTAVAAGATIAANSFNSGDAGRVVVWADGTTHFFGEINAQAFGGTGDGGFVEVSGKENLGFQGIVSTASLNGENGDLLLDPGILSILFGGLTGSLDTLASTALGTILGTDGGANESVSANVLQSLAGAGNNINLAANNEINYVGPAGSHLNLGDTSFTAEVMTGDINLNNMDITAYRGVNLDGANINVGSIYTNPNMSGMTTGDVTFNATGNVNVNNVFAEGSDGDAMNINGQNGGTVNGDLTTGNFVANNVYQQGGAGGFGGSPGNGGDFNVDSTSGTSTASISGTLNSQGGQGGSTSSNPPIPGGSPGSITGNTTPSTGMTISGMGLDGVVNLPGGGGGEDDRAGIGGGADLGFIDVFDFDGPPLPDPFDQGAFVEENGNVDAGDFGQIGAAAAGTIEAEAFENFDNPPFADDQFNQIETAGTTTHASSERATLDYSLGYLLPQDFGEIEAEYDDSDIELESAESDSAGGDGEEPPNQTGPSLSQILFEFNAAFQDILSESGGRDIQDAQTAAELTNQAAQDGSVDLPPGVFANQRRVVLRPPNFRVDPPEIELPEVNDEFDRGAQPGPGAENGDSGEQTQRRGRGIFGPPSGERLTERGANPLPGVISAENAGIVGEIDENGELIRSSGPNLSEALFSLAGFFGNVLELSGGRDVQDAQTAQELVDEGLAQGVSADVPPGVFESRRRVLIRRPNFRLDPPDVELPEVDDNFDLGPPIDPDAEFGAAPGFSRIDPEDQPQRGVLGIIPALFGPGGGERLVQAGGGR